MQISPFGIRKRLSDSQENQGEEGEKYPWPADPVSGARRIYSRLHWWENVFPRRAP